MATELTLAMSLCEQFEVMMYYCNCQAFHFLISQWGRSEVEATGLNDLFSGSRELTRFCKATQVDWTMSYLMYKDFPPQKRFAAFITYPGMASGCPTIKSSPGLG